MKFKTIKIFVSGMGLQKMTRKEFIENLDSGVYDKMKIEIVEMEY